MIWSDTPDRFSCVAAHVNLKQEDPDSSLKAVVGFLFSEADI